MIQDKEENETTKKKGPSMEEVRESLLLQQSQIQEEMTAIHEQLKELRREVKMRGGKKYNALIRSFVTLSKRFNDNLALQGDIHKLEGFRASEKEEEDLALQMMRFQKRHGAVAAEGVEKRMMLLVKDAKIVKRTLMVKKGPRKPPSKKTFGMGW